MSRWDWHSFQDERDYEQGREDGRYGFGHPDPSRDQYSDENAAYWDGFNDGQRHREEEQREQEYEEECDRLRQLERERERAEIERELEEEYRADQDPYPGDDYNEDD